MRVTVLLFGPQAAAMNAPRIEVETPTPATPASLLTSIAAQHPALTPTLAATRVARNGAFARPDEPLNPADELALIAMVSGG